MKIYSCLNLQIVMCVILLYMLQSLGIIVILLQATDPCHASTRPLRRLDTALIKVTAPS